MSRTISRPEQPPFGGFSAHKQPGKQAITPDWHSGLDSDRSETADLLLTAVVREVRPEGAALLMYARLSTNCYQVMPDSRGCAEGCAELWCEDKWLNRVVQELLAPALPKAAVPPGDTSASGYSDPLRSCRKLRVQGTNLGSRVVGGTRCWGIRRTAKVPLEPGKETVRDEATFGTSALDGRILRLARDDGHIKRELHALRPAPDRRNATRRRKLAPATGHAALRG